MSDPNFNTYAVNHKNSVLNLAKNLISTQRTDVFMGVIDTKTWNDVRGEVEEIMDSLYVESHDNNGKLKNFNDHSFVCDIIYNCSEILKHTFWNTVGGENVCYNPDASEETITNILLKGIDNEETLSVCHVDDNLFHDIYDNFFIPFFWGILTKEDFQQIKDYYHKQIDGKSIDELPKHLDINKLRNAIEEIDKIKFTEGKNESLIFYITKSHDE